MAQPYTGIVERLTLIDKQLIIIVPIECKLNIAIWVRRTTSAGNEASNAYNFTVICSRSARVTMTGTVINVMIQTNNSISIIGVILNPIQMVRHFSVAIGLRSATAANNETGNTHQFVIVGSWTTGITHASTMANAMSQTDQRF
ncbi:hypothetical protein GQX74_007775 [Glossina fuscipes]|nr:hypothetical protein GQX74_007775 [Glossina fuscipes]